MSHPQPTLLAAGEVSSLILEQGTGQNHNILCNSISVWPLNPDLFKALTSLAEIILALYGGFPIKNTMCVCVCSLKLHDELEFFIMNSKNKPA